MRKYTAPRRIDEEASNPVSSIDDRLRARVAYIDENSHHNTLRVEYSGDGIPVINRGHHNIIYQSRIYPPKKKTRE